MVNRISIILLLNLILAGCYTSSRMITSTYSVYDTKPKLNLEQNLTFDLRPVLKLDNTTYFMAGRSTGFSNDKSHGDAGKCNDYDNRLVIHLWAKDDLFFMPDKSYFVFNNQKIEINEVKNYRAGNVVYKHGNETVRLRKSNSNFESIAKLIEKRNTSFPERTGSNKYLISAASSLGCLDDEFTLHLALGEIDDSRSVFTIYFYPAEFISTKH